MTLFWSSNVSLTPNRTLQEWRLQAQMLRSVKTRCGRAPSLWGLEFRAVITWEDSGIRWKTYSCGCSVCVCVREKERILKIKGWVVDWRMERLSLTFLCKEVHMYIFTDVCVHTEGRQVSRWQTEDDCNLLGRFQSWMCGRLNVNLGVGWGRAGVDVTFTGWIHIFVNMWNYVEYIHAFVDLHTGTVAYVSL